MCIMHGISIAMRDSIFSTDDTSQRQYSEVISSFSKDSIHPVPQYLEKILCFCHACIFQPNQPITIQILQHLSTLVHISLSQIKEIN